MRRVKKPLGIQLGLELLEGNLKIACPLGHDLRAIELIGAIPRIDGDPAPDRDAHAVLRAKTQLHGAVFEHDALQAAFTVFQREVMVPGGIDLVV